MKNKCSAIILGAGKELIDKPHHGKSPPTSLLEDQYGESVLKWILNSLNRNNIEKIREGKLCGLNDIENLIPVTSIPVER